jgi:hypothetical protein
MCCGPRGHPGGWHTSHPHAGFCGCSGHPAFGPCFPSKKERIAHLERYLENLQQTAKHVEECLANMKEEE